MVGRHLRSLLWIIAAVHIGACASMSSPVNFDGRGHVALHTGIKAMESADWNEVADQTFAGVSVDWTQSEGLFGIEAAVLPSVSTEESTSLGPLQSLAVNEYALGLFFPFRTGWRDTIFRAGLGLAMLNYRYSQGSTSYDDDQFGAYAHAGLLVPVGSALHAGLDVRLGEAGDPDFEFGSGRYTQLTLVIAYGF
jgi:hypothetical protein